jgi:hypothetical protein
MRESTHSVKLFDGTEPQAGYRGRTSELPVKCAAGWTALGFAAIVLFSTAATAVTKYAPGSIQPSQHTLKAGPGLHGLAVNLY